MTEGIDVNIFNTIGKLWNFTYSALYCNETWGHKLANNTWNGAIGKLQNLVHLILINDLLFY